MDIHSRKDYLKNKLLEEDTPQSPFDLFEKWYASALIKGIDEPYIMTLATVGNNGQPSARVVLLRKFNDEGFSFFTNYLSKKGQQLDQNNLGALLFFWQKLECQIRIEGKIIKTSEEESIEYFKGRPPGSRIGAWSSPQSSEIPSREYLENNYDEFLRKYIDKEIPRPENWGGYRLIPSLFEFWQGRENRLHDRIEYNLTSNGWKKRRLAP